MPCRRNLPQYQFFLFHRLIRTQIFTLSEIAGRLKVSERWVYEKTRRRCLNPLPCIRIGRYLRFNWQFVSAWLNQHQTGGAR